MPKQKHLLIVSDSPMCHDGQGMRIIESTLREVEHLTEIFETITWIGFERKDMLLGGSRYERTGKITAIPLKLYGGGGLINKVKQILALPSYWFTIWKHLKHADFVHTRAPSVPALLVLLYNFIDHKRKYWHKFAGDWTRQNPPRSYAIQKKWMLKLKHSKITINGQWPNQPNHVLAFENPCISQTELKQANHAALQKTWNGKINILFVGRIETEKGVDRLMMMLEKLSEAQWEQIGWVKLVGIGRDQGKVQQQIELLNKPVYLTGSLNREQLNVLYSESHVFVLPTEGEGFPKVISESVSYGCVPIVTNVSSITQYILHQENGLILSHPDATELMNHISYLLSNHEHAQRMSASAIQLSQLFTYERYNQRIATEVFGFTL